MPGGRKRTRGSRGAGGRKRSRQNQDEVAQIGGASQDSESLVGAPRGRDQSQTQQGPSNLSSHITDFETILRESGTLQGQNITEQTSSVPPSNTNPHISQNAGTQTGHASQPAQNTDHSDRFIWSTVSDGCNFSFGEEPLRLGSDELSAHVPLAIAQKIWSNQYININLLLKGAVELQELCAGGAIRLNKQGLLESKPQVFKDPVPTIEKWTDAFLIFSSIYLKKHPERTQELLQYMNVIREAASRSTSFAWRNYDEQFRLRQAINIQPWGQLNTDLWLRVMTLSANSTVPFEHSSFNRLKCLDFNHGICNFKGCKFLHACSHCGGTNHGRQNCFKLVPPATRSVPLAIRGGFTFRPGRGQSSANRGGRAVRR